MTGSTPEIEAAPKRLVANRADFVVVYMASFATTLAILLAVQIVGFYSESWLDFLMPAVVGAVLSLLPAAIAAFVPSGRRALQVMFGVGLLPVVGAVAINGWNVIKALLQ